MQYPLLKLYMDNFSSYVYGWNDWVVGPILLFIAIVSYARLRKRWLLLIALGLAFTVLSNVPSRLDIDPAYKPLTSLVISAIGFAFGALGCIGWWLDKKNNVDNQRKPQ